MEQLIAPMCCCNWPRTRPCGGAQQNLIWPWPVLRHPQNTNDRSGLCVAFAVAQLAQLGRVCTVAQLGQVLHSCLCSVLHSLAACAQ
jgi:hypothetical protein